MSMLMALSHKQLLAVDQEACSRVPCLVIQKMGSLKSEAHSSTGTKLGIPAACSQISAFLQMLSALPWAPEYPLWPAQFKPQISTLQSISLRNILPW